MVNVALVGCGYFSRFHIDAWKRIENVNLVALIDRDASIAMDMADTHGIAVTDSDLETVLRSNSIDLVDIVTPPETHLDLIASAAAHNVDVVCQKPLAPNIESAMAIVALAERAEIDVTVHENFRFQPWYREICHLVDDDVIGGILGATFRLRPGDGRGADAYLARQPYFRSMERFLVHETLIHLIDVFRFLFGEVLAVTARLRRLNPAIAGEDSGIIILEQRCRRTCREFETIIDGNRLASHPAGNPRLTMGEMVIDGMEGSLKLDGDATIWLRNHESQFIEHAYHFRDHGFGGDCVHALCRHVIDNRGTARIENRAADYIANIRIEEAVYQSHQEGRRIELSAH